MPSRKKTPHIDPALPKTPRDKQEYNPQDIEPKWQKIWDEKGVFSPSLSKAKKPYYNLMMFPYPSAEGLHVGNLYAFTGADVWGRFIRMQGYDVFEPIGLDGFGIHSENYAIKIGEHPRELSERTEKRFYEQLRLTGNAYDWRRTLETYDIDYYKWTQWLFVQMFKHGLAYRQKAEVNWCPSCKTVLSDEQVISGECERCGTQVERRELEQWFFRITDYADRLLENLDKIDWSPKVKLAQKNWIGKSEGAEISFPLKLDGEVGSEKWETGKRNGKLEKNNLTSHINDPASYISRLTSVSVFTTRPDTLHGATFLVLSPESALVEKIATKEHKENVSRYIKSYQTKDLQDRERPRLPSGDQRAKSGVFTGSYAINPVTGQEIPIWVADYVLAGYGSGAVMGVPAHDQRDFEFAQKYNLPIKPVIRRENAPIKSYLMGAADIKNKDLEELGIKIVRQEEDGSRWVEIPKQKLAEYENLIKEKLTPGYWNEYIGEEVVFLFKHKDGKVERLVLAPETEKKIDRLGAEFNNEPYEESDVWSWFVGNSWYRDLVVHEEYGVLINSGQFSGLTSQKAIEKIIDHLENNNLGKKQVQYHLRDWLISRQRYWGPPIPMIYCENCAKQNKGEREDMSGWYTVSEAELPVELPYIKNYQPKGTHSANSGQAGESPLAQDKEWMNIKCPKCGGEARRETDVSDTFLDSAWYFLRYLATDREDVPFPSEKFGKELGEIEKNWLPVDMYIGGAEHAVLHLMYVRFVTMALHDWSYLRFEEPFPRFYAHGLIIKDGAKMSKSKGNVVIPDEYVRKFGADTLRTYLMFLGPFDQGGDFRDTGIEGMNRFIRRVWNLVVRSKQYAVSSKEDAEEVVRVMHKTIKRVTEDMEGLRYNRAIAGIMEYINHLKAIDKKQSLPLRGGQQTLGSISGEIGGASQKNKDLVPNAQSLAPRIWRAEWDEAIRVLLLLLSPFAPHMTEELWQMVGNKQSLPTDKQSLSVNKQSLPLRGGQQTLGSISGEIGGASQKNKDLVPNASIHLQPWPTYDSELIKEDVIKIPVQINGRLRATFTIDRTEAENQEIVESKARQIDAVARYLDNTMPKKVVFVPARLINFVI